MLKTEKKSLAVNQPIQVSTFDERGLLLKSKEKKQKKKKNRRKKKKKRMKKRNKKRRRKKSNRKRSKQIERKLFTSFRAEHTNGNRF